MLFYSKHTVQCTFIISDVMSRYVGTLRVFGSTQKSPQLTRMKPSSPRTNKSEISLSCERLRDAQLLSPNDSK